MSENYRWIQSAEARDIAEEYRRKGTVRRRAEDDQMHSLSVAGGFQSAEGLRGARCRVRSALENRANGREGEGNGEGTWDFSEHEKRALDREGD